MGQTANAQYIGEDLFAYAFPELVITAVAGNDTQQVIIQDDSDFELLALMYHFTLANAAFLSGTRPIPNWTVQITDTGSGAALFNVPVPLDSIAVNGESGSPRPLPASRYFRRNSTIQIQVFNFDAAVVSGQARVTMVGIKHYLAL